ncbi:SDR family oxidoreductase [Streptomyces sp. AK04-3B]|uniref:SDR family NAD(P)-dependent oxidoreductase n=1 Tax=Streptomyces sp. AK04-3B TaxID=3028650 RepID=UPI0029BB2D2B|nr:SDR family oxidoreductase [Streptomyces sp. AK04-3B]MDX3800421.1 SDR family NAD(P)-dependent oxidoreductase [Streptomyces sp. AK04-3B]
MTGGGGGIGQAIAKKLASEGADVAVADLKPADETKALVEATGQRFFSAQVDISGEAQVNAFAAQVREALGPVDIVVNNAAVTERVDFDNVTFENWNKIISVNAGGAFLTSKAFLDQVKDSSAGRVINMTTTAYWESPPSFVAYVTSKAAINGLTYTMAADLAQYDVTVNAVAPSVVRTPLTLPRVSEALFESHMQRQNLKRQQKPEDVADTVAFLASDEAAFITGQIIAVDGGLTRR